MSYTFMVFPKKRNAGYGVAVLKTFVKGLFIVFLYKSADIEANGFQTKTPTMF